MPGWVTTKRFATSIARIRRIFSVLTTMHPSMAFAAPDSPLRAPCGTTGTPSFVAVRNACWTCAVSRASTTAAGTPAGQNCARSYR